MLAEQKINSNYLTFIQKMQNYGCYSESMLADIGEKIKTAPYSKNSRDGGAYVGGLVETTLFTLCRIAVSINEGFVNTAPELHVNNNMLIKCLLLLNIAKAEMFEPEEEQYMLKKGNIYKFSNKETYLRVGERSLFMCNKYGISLEEEEFAAILLSDNREENARIAESPLCQIIAAARNLTQTYLTIKNKD